MQEQRVGIPSLSWETRDSLGMFKHRAGIA